MNKNKFFLILVSISLLSSAKNKENIETAPIIEETFYHNKSPKCMLTGRKFRPFEERLVYRIENLDLTSKPDEAVKIKCIYQVQIRQPEGKNAFTPEILLSYSVTKKGSSDAILKYQNWREKSWDDVPPTPIEEILTGKRTIFLNPNYGTINCGSLATYKLVLDIELPPGEESTEISIYQIKYSSFSLSECQSVLNLSD